MKMRDPKAWAKNEIELGKKEYGDTETDNEIKKYYDKAYEIYSKYIDEIGDNRKTEIMVRTIFTALLNEQNLTPIT